MITCGRCKVPKDRLAFYIKSNGTPQSWCKQCYADYHKETYVPRIRKPVTTSFICEYCSVRFTPKCINHAVMRFCSRGCKDKFKNEKARIERASQKPVRKCIWCNKTLSPTVRIDAKFCSEKCNSAAHQCVRKMAKRVGEDRNSAYMRVRTLLADRDGLLCSLCQESLSLDTKHPDPLYASVDHVIPLARGGNNDWNNLALAHLVCNCTKRARMEI